MEKFIVIQNPDTSKYYTGREWEGSEGSWTRDFFKAQKFKDEEEISLLIGRQLTEQEFGGEFTQGKTFIMITGFKTKNKDEEE